MTLPNRLLRDDPFIPGKNNLEDISQINSRLIAGDWANRTVEAKAELMPTEIAQMYNRWAIAHPTVNPRTWAPLAQMGIDPWSDAGQQVANGDITGAVANGTYDKYVGTQQPADPPPKTAPIAAPAPTDDSSGGFWSGLTHAVTAPITASEGLVHGVVGLGVNSAEAGVRGAEAVLSAPYQSEIATGRTNLGAEAHRQDLITRVGKKQGMTPEETSQLNDLLNPGGASLTSPQANIDQARHFIPDLFPDTATQDKYNAALDAYSTIVNDPKFASQFQGSQQNYSKVFQQTDLGIVARSFVDGVKGNYLTSRPETGAVFDPKTKTWKVQEDDGTVRDAKMVDHGGIFVPSEVQTEAVANAIKAYDIRTPEEIKNGVAPVAWTPGRGIAHLRYGADDQAFYTLSGAVDIQYSLFGDPINIVPLGGLGKVLKSTSATAKAFSQHGDDVVVATRGAMRAGTEAIPSAATEARVGSRLAAKGVQEGELYLDPVMSSRGYLLEGNRVVKAVGAGLVNTPHAKFVAKKDAWNWLNTGKGARAVDELSKMTSPTQIWLRSNRQIDGDLAKLFARANSPEEVRAILGSRIGVDITDARTLGKIGGVTPTLAKVPGIGPGLLKGLDPAGAELASGYKGAWRTNFERGGIVGSVRGIGRDPFRLAPSSGVGVDAEDVDSVLEEFERFFRGTATDDPATIGALDDLVNAPNGIARYNAVYDEDNGVISHVARRLVDEHGLPPEYAKKITRAFASGLDEHQRLWVNKDLGSASYGAASADGEIGRPLLLNEQMSNRLYLPDYRTLRRATGYLKTINNVAGASAAEKSAMVSDYLTGVTSVWRDWTLARPAYMLREMGELGFSMSLAGGKGAFTHPYGFIAAATQSAAAWHMHTLMGRVFGNLAAAPADAMKAAMDSGQRLLITGRAERELYVRSAVEKGESGMAAAAKWDSMDQASRGDFIWENADRNALAEYLKMHEGVSWLMPHVNSRWARVNGKTMYEEFGKAMDGDEAAFAKFQHELSFSAGPMIIDEPAVRGAARHVRSINREDPEQWRDYLHSLIDSKMTRLSEDKLMRDLAKGDKDAHTLAAQWHGTKDWAMRREMRRDLWQTHPDKQMADISLGEDIDYVTGYANMLQKVTGGDSQLLDAVATGKFADKPITSANADLVRYLEQKMGDENFRKALPNVLHDIPGGYGAKGNYQRAVNNFFTNNGEMSDIFGRSPMVRFFYTQWVKEHAPYLSTQARERAVANLRAAGDTNLAREIERADTRVARQGGAVREGTLGVDEMELAASGYARRSTARVFYNAHRRQNYAIAMRVLVPFVQATLNTFKRWGVLSLQNPQLAYRTLKPIQALRQPGSSVIYEVLGDITGDKAMQGMFTPGHPEASVDGFFMHNAYGQRVFAFPGIRQVFNFMSGPWNPISNKDIPEGAVPLAQAANLNVAGGTLNAGMGPLVTFPASLVVGSKVYEDNWVGSLTRAMFPYGIPQGSGWSKLIGSFAPTFLRKSVIPEDMQANHATMLMPSLAATGQYDLSKQSEVRRMAQDARELSGRMDKFAAFFGGITPTTFNWNYALEVTGNDKEGKVRWFMMADRLAQEWRKYTAPKNDSTWQEDYNNGAINFLKDFGIYSLYSVMPRTEQPGVPFAMAPTADIWSFRTDEPDAYKNNRGVIGLFFPGGDSANEWGSAQQNFYAWQKAEGERTYKSADDFWRDANISIGWILKSVATGEAMAATTDPEEQSVILAKRDDEIANAFPGWTPDPTDPGKFRRIITELGDAVEDPAIQTLPGTPFIAGYLSARQDAIDSLRDQGYNGTLSADYAAPERAKLAALATQLVRQDTSGTFKYAWTRVFGGELETG